MIILELLKQSIEFLGNKNNAPLDCEVLLAYVLNVDKEYLFAHYKEDVDDFTVALFNTYLKHIKDGEPLAYILGEKEFYGLNFFVDERVLIPRPETELLVDKVLDYLRDNYKKNHKFKILDVGTGSGNVAVSIGKTVFDLNGAAVIEQIDAIDISEGAVEVAKINVSQHGLDEMIHVYQSDLLENVDEEERFDIIVANLPYIGEVKNRYISKEVERYEPKHALFAGEDGLELYKKLFQEIFDKKINYEMIVGEFGFGQTEDMKELLNKYFDQRWVIEKDLSNIDRIFVIN